MVVKKRPLDKVILDFVAGLPAEALCKIKKQNEGFLALLDLGSNRYVGDAYPMGEYGTTPLEACEKMKAWLLDDLSCGGKKGKPHYQPHWGSYDIKYRFGDYWESRKADLAAIRAEHLELLKPVVEAPTPPTDYEGWENSATYLTNLYMAQTPHLYAKIVNLFKAGGLTAKSLKQSVRVVINKHEDEACGYVQGNIRLDVWAKGTVNWQEMVDNWLTELSPATA